MDETPETQETLDRLTDLPSVILTPRLKIEPLTPHDVPDLAAAMQETWRHLHRWTTTATYPADKCIQKEAALSSGRLDEFELRQSFFMVARPHGERKIASFVSLYDVSDDARNMQGGYWTRQSFAGQGLTTEAMTGLLHWAYKKVGATTIIARCQEGHNASEKILTKLGFEFTRTSAEPVRTPGGKHVHERFFLHSRQNLPELAVTFGG